MTHLSREMATGSRKKIMREKSVRQEVAFESIAGVLSAPMPIHYDRTFHFNRPGRTSMKRALLACCAMLALDKAGGLRDLLEGLFF